MTELYINGNYIELDNSELLPTSQVADIFSVEDIYSGITKQFSAPKTASNKAALEGCDSIGAITYVPYRRNTAKLLIDGVEVFFNAIAIIDSTGDTFEIVIKYGNSDFFSLLTRKLSELDLSALEHAWTMAQVSASQSYDYSDGYTWQLIDFGLQKLQPRYNIRQALPSVFVRYLIEKIAADIGYTLNGAIWTADEFSRDTIPLMTRNISDSIKTKMQVLAWQNSVQVFNYGDDNPIAFADELIDSYGAFNGQEYRSLIDCTINVSIYLNFKSIVHGSITPINTLSIVKRDILGENTIIYSEQLTSYDGTFTINSTTEINEYDVISCRFSTLGSVGNVIEVGNPNYSTFWVQIVSAANTAPGIDYPISENLPDLTESELFKAVAMKYGLIYKTDIAAKILYAERFEDIAGRMNTNDSYNWTDKLDLSEQDGDYERININFRTEMGQKSWFRFAEDETLPKFFKDASFNIDDTTLQKSFDYVEFPFAASKMVVRAGYSMPEIKLYTDYDGGQNSIVKRWLQNTKQSTSTLLLRGKSDMTVKLTSTGTILGLALTGATPALLIDWDTNKETTIDAWISEHNQTLNDIGIICYRISNDSIRFITKALGCAFSNINNLGGDVSISVTDNSENYTHTGDVSLATFTDAATILSTYYSAQERMFNYYKRITCKVWLSVYDFVNFSHYKPVYIQELGWFYVERINGFRTDASTEVEMVALDSFINAGRSEFSFEREIDSLDVVFTSESTNALSYKWDFGDGTLSTSQNPSKTYTSCGVYNVTLTVTDTQGVTNKLTKVVNVPTPSLRFNFKCNSQYISNII